MFEISDNITAVSSVVGVLVVVLLIVSVSSFASLLVFDFNDQNDTGQSSIRIEQGSDEFNIQSLKSGNTEEISVILNGRKVTRMDSSAGSVIDLSDQTQLCQDDTVTLNSLTEDTQNVLQQERVESDISCEVIDTTTTSTARYNGSSWIVETFLLNTGTQEKSYIVTISNGVDQQVTDTVTLQPGESTTITSTESSYSSSDPISVGVLSPDQSSSGYSIASGGFGGGGGSGFGFAGGSTAGGYYYTPTGTDGTQVQSSESPSTFESTDSSTDSSTDEPSLELSTSRVRAGDSASLFAAINTTKSPSATERLVAYATETNTSSKKIIDQQYEISEGELKRVSPSFTIDETGQYVISVSLAGSNEVYNVGTLNVVNGPDFGVQASSFTPLKPDVGDEITLFAGVENRESEAKNVTVEFFEGGEPFVTREVNISGGKTRTITENFTITEHRSYVFHLGLIEPAIVEKIGDISRTSFSTDDSGELFSEPSDTAPSSDTYDIILSNVEGDGTLDNPFVITNDRQLQAVNGNRSAHYELGQNINATETENWNDGSGLEEIGSFSGVFDGNGHIIEGLTLVRSGGSFEFGLFKQNSGTIKNVGLANASVTGSSGSDSANTGIIVGKNSGLISNTYATGSVNADRTAGGLVGFNRRGTVRNSYTFVSVSGGDVGAGGITGNSFDDRIVNSYAVSDVSGDFGAKGGIIGNSIGSTSSSGVYWDTEATGQSSSGGAGTGLTTDQMQGSSAATNMSAFDFSGSGNWSVVIGPDDYPVLRAFDVQQQLQARN